MIITHELTMDLKQRGGGTTVYAMQDDRYCRNLKLSLTADGESWPIPGDAAVLIRYSKPDGKGGEYDTLPDGSCAWAAEGNVLTVALAPQVLTVPGAVRLSVTLMQGEIQLSTFAIPIWVEQAVNAEIGESETYFHVPGFLPAPGNAEAGQFLQIAAVDSAGHVTGTRCAALPEGVTPVQEPDAGDIPRVFFDEALPQTGAQTVMALRYHSKTGDIRGYCRLKAREGDAMDCPKRDQIAELFADAACTQPLAVNFKGWDMHSTFCLRGNWEDLTHARNIVSARLWGEMAASRDNYAELPWGLRASPNQGAEDGFPVKVYAKGIYQGRYTLNIPQAPWMAGMDAQNENHCTLRPESHDSGCLRAAAVFDGSDWSAPGHTTVPEAIQARWNEAIAFVGNRSSEEFVAGIGNYFDVPSLIDHYLLSLILCNPDGFGTGQLYHTYDAQKWYAAPGDLTHTLGLRDGALLPAACPRAQFADFQEGRRGNLLYIRLEKLFFEKIQKRYQELKAGVLSLTNILDHFEQFTDIAPGELVAEDYAPTTAEGLFTQIPLQAENNIRQIRSFIAARYPYVDTHILSLGIPGQLLYKLPAETVFDGTDDYLDTGVKLLEEPMDFTIVCDATLDENIDANKGIYTAFRNDNGGSQSPAGFQCVTQSDGSYGLTAIHENGNVYVCTRVNAKRVKHVAVFRQGALSSVYSVTESGGAITQFDTQEYAYTAHSYPLQLGFIVGWYQSKQGFAPMTVHDFEIWDYAMTLDDAAEKLQ